MGRERRRASAFTLVEVVLALAMMGLLTAGLASALVLATRALPEKDSALRQQVRTADAIDRLAEELSSAVRVLQKSSTGITFLVPDRNGDNKPEKIIYSWSGTVGEALTRRMGTGLQEDALEDVREFELRYETTEVTETYKAPLVESAEQVLASVTSGLATSSDKIKKSRCFGQHFIPNLPTSVQSYVVSTIRLDMQSSGTTEETAAINLYVGEGSGLPQFIGSPLGTGTILESTLPASYQWVSVPITGMLPVPREQRLSLTVSSNDSSGDALQFRFQNGLVLQGSAGMLSKLESGTWTFEGLKALHYEVRGRTYSESGTTQSVTRRYLRRVEISAKASDLDEAAVKTSVSLGNEPEELSALWRADFGTTPTLDQNGDGQADWAVQGGGAFSGTLAGGVWTPGGQINSYPDNDFAEVTTIDVHARATTAGASANFQISPDWTLSNAGKLVALVRLEANGTQTLEVQRAVNASTLETVVRVADLPVGEFVRVRLVIDPTRNTFAASVNGVHRGTFPYATFLHLTQDKYASVFSSGGTAQFDWVSIRVGGTAG